MHKSQDEKIKLLSIQEKKTLETTFQFVISLGIVQNLLPGVGIPLEIKCKNWKNINSENISEFAKYKQLCFVVDTLLKLDEVDIFHDLLISKHLEDVLAALFQLSFAPLKKPVPSCSNTSETEVGDNYETKKMTFAVWSELEQNKRIYKERLTKMQINLYKPLIIRKYLIILGNPKIPRWMQQNLVRMLTDLILEENGIAAAVQGIVEIDNDSPVQSSHCLTVAKLIAVLFSDENETHVKLLIPQLLKMLSSDRNKTYEYIFIHVAASAISQVLSRCPQLVEKYLLDEIFRPLKTGIFTDEESTSRLVNQLYNLCIVPSNNLISVPVCAIVPASSILFSMHCQIKDGPCYLKSLVRELLAKLLLETDNKILAKLFNSLVFDEEQQPIILLPKNKKFVLSEQGGLELVNAERNPIELEKSSVFLELIKSIDGNEKLVNSFFIHLLRKYVDEYNNEANADKRVVIIFSLTTLSQDATTQKYILKNAENIIQFIAELLQIHSDKDEEANVDVLCICLTFLTMVLYDLRKKKDVKWIVFTALLSPLQKLKKFSLLEVRLLAEKVYNLILTRNVAGECSSNDNCSSNLLIEEIEQSPYEKAIEDAHNPLLPVRAHALMELIRLIKNGDSETLAKKEELFCLFQENLKDKDSFLYLRAIEGLSCLAALKPHNVLPLLCEELTSCNITEIRLEIGEILVRTVQYMNDFVLVHKRLLVNTFLNGSKDTDSLVRASSLSNLGQICLELKNNVDDILYEVIYCAQNIMSFDKDVEPRRAAVFLISSLLRGLKTSMFKVLEYSLHDLYQLLKRIHANDEDERVRLHAKLSLEVLDENMKEFFAPKTELQKKIHILYPL